MPRRPNPLFRRGLGAIPGTTMQQLLAQAAARYGVDLALLLKQAQQESGFRNVVNPRSGACGILQLMPATAAQYGVSNCLDAAQNIDAGVHYLADLLSQFSGDVAKALAAYDWGPGNLGKAIAQWGDQWLAHAPAETRAYVAAISGISAPLAGPGIPPATEPPLTIDAATGLPVDDSTPTPGAVQTASILPQTPGQILLLTAAGIGAYLLADLLSD